MLYLFSIKSSYCYIKTSCLVHSRPFQYEIVSCLSIHLIENVHAGLHAGDLDRLSNSSFSAQNSTKQHKTVQKMQKDHKTHLSAGSGDVACVRPRPEPVTKENIYFQGNNHHFQRNNRDFQVKNHHCILKNHDLYRNAQPRFSCWVFAHRRCLLNNHLNDEFVMHLNDDFCIKNDEFCITSGSSAGARVP